MTPKSSECRMDSKNIVKKIMLSNVRLFIEKVSEYNFKKNSSACLFLQTLLLNNEVFKIIERSSKLFKI